jgi:8-oxo-dGTP pyrophosphatase MutT (NUDIX family)
MKTIITNNYNLKEEDMTEVVKRVKLLLVNSNNEVLLGYSHHEYQFPGGHVEEDENLVDAINREVLEETGIELNITHIEPFACAMGYYKDWPAEGKNRKIEIYYYEIKTNKKPDLNKTSYTENEKNGNFELRYIPLLDIINVLEENAKKYGDNRGIAKEMIDLFKIYNEK